MGTVVLYAGEADATHEQNTRAEIAREIAALACYEFAGRFAPGMAYRPPVYFVPAETIDRATAQALGIEGETDIFGGVVPQSFVATKVITHELVAEHAPAPAGWSTHFARAVKDVVLGGFTAFCTKGARLACERLLAAGPLRAKPPHGIGGRGQRVLRDRAEVDALLAELDPSSLSREGLVFEENLDDCATYSVGQVRIGGITASYVGTQHVTRDHHGNEVYGGSRLLVARGDFTALLALDLDDCERTVVARARVYNDAAHASFPGFFASRCNYDVARGHNARGDACCGVLEQSWRIGGASGVEIAALTAFRSDPDLVAVRAASYEVFDPSARPPRDAKVYFHGVDDKVGHLLKYVVIDEYVRR